MASNFVLAYIFTFFIFSLGDKVRHHPLNFEAHLRRALFSNWVENDIHSTPVLNPTDPIKVIFGLEVYHIKYLDEIKQVLTLNGIMHLSWENPRLTWNRSEYGNIESITLPSDYMWLPDIYLYNSANGGEILKHGPAEARIYYNGTIYWKPQVTLHVKCPLNNYHFPFEENICKMIFLSWTTHDLNMIIEVAPIMKKKGFLKDNYNNFNEWKIIDAQTNRSFMYFEFYQYVQIELSLHLKRQASIYWHTLIIPLVVTMMIMVTIFWLPPLAGEKFTLGGVNLVVITIILIHIYWIIPRNYNLPIIVAVAATTYFFMALCLIISVATSVLSFRFDATPEFVERHLKGRLGSILYIPSVPIQVVENSDDDMKNNWSLVAVAINRIAFAFYCIIVFVLFILMIA